MLGTWLAKRQRVARVECRFVSFVAAVIVLLTAAAHGGEFYQPKSGQQGKDVVWVGNPEAMVRRMLDVASVTPQDYVVDLGSGDGRNVIAAAKRGARAHGIEYNPDLVEFAKRAARNEGVAERATFERGDVFATDFSKATVVVLFLTPEMNIRLRPKLLSLKPGTRIVANTFAIGDWNPDQSFSAGEGCDKFCDGRLWIVPAYVNGTWRIPRGEIVLKQVYQTFTGSLRSGASTALIAGRLHGDRASFRAGQTDYTVRIEGQVMTGFARTAGVDNKFSAQKIFD